jgi:phosphate transport system substrate-binding protein
VPNTLGQLSRIIAVVAVASFAASACGEIGPEADSTSAASASSTSGSVFISGSSTVEPVSVRVAEMFEEVASDVSVDVEGPGTGDGFKKFCEGETDISDASRAIKESEAEACAASGIEFTEILVGIDGIAIMTNTANDLVDCVTIENLYGLVGPESDDIANWIGANDIAGEGMPDAPLDIFGPGAESGTYDSFIEIALEDISAERGWAAITRTDYNPSAEDNLILQGIQSSDTSLGWIGYAFATNADVKLLEVDGGDGCIAATAETIASNDYPISRNLYIYVNDTKAANSAALREFVDFYISTGLDDAVAEVGYVELADESKVTVRTSWNG